ncbi:YolD-like family protein [Neobacillus drentensis]|uniref:YolD-like family protein n=1 Tax=Neobacillus drentensis TaxID=220684 RepID=UPI001F222A8C|nr:YolD-like family protein [Neobacillus drentensis]ULT55872.1 YolD-like family protein [Neobacillus drentensis]
MAIRDRGKKKWQFAFGMPELIKFQRDLWRDTERIVKPIIDEYEKEEFDQRIGYAMEYGLAVRVTIWDDGFTSDITGRVHYVDPITHQLRIEVDPEDFRRVAFEDVVGMVVIEMMLLEWNVKKSAG